MGFYIMTPRERAVAALTLNIPDQVPTFELEFQLEDLMFGKPFLHQEDLIGKSQKEREFLIISPAMFGEFIQPYLYQIIQETKKAGAYTIKHTDGNIMPILD